MTQQLAKEMGVNDRQLIHIRRGALLHNVGTIMIPEKILHKTSPLTPRELKIFEQHPVYSFNMLSTINFLRPALDIPYCHHENWDGTGYPRSLKGDVIPIAARIFTVAEEWEAITHDHREHKALNEEEALSLIAERAGKRFDPRVVAAFHKIIKKS
jgi:HD-GYP domain-containing protein (c-di-GMP phosphodiesterase class II)